MSGGGAFFSSPPSIFGSSDGSGGPLPGCRCRYVHYPVEISAEAPVPVAPALDELDQALLLQEVQVTLDRPGASGEPPCQGLHARPAQSGLVVRVIGEGAVGGYHLRGHPRQDQVVDLGYAGESGSNRHDQPPRGRATGPPW